MRFSKNLPTRLTVQMVAAMSLLTPLLMGQAASAQNLIVNADFSAGDTAFSSQYDGSGAGNGDGFYSITNDAWGAYGDHTTGSGLMMLINGSTNSSLAFWQQTLSVTPNTTYIFSGWVANTTEEPFGIIDFQVNGSSLGTITTSSAVGDWTQFSGEWFSGSETSASLSLYDNETAPMGNDFTVDDLSFQVKNDGASTSAPEPGSIALLLMAGIPALGLVRRHRSR